MSRLLLVWVLVMGGHSLSAAATYVVDAAAGHDASPGTARQPFRSIAKAAPPIIRTYSQPMVVTTVILAWSPQRCGRRGFRQISTQTG
jgi:hypothetical protein